MTTQTSASSNAGFIAIDAADSSLYAVQTCAPGPAGSLPLDDDFLRTAPSGHIFGLTQDAGMGWEPALLRRKEFLILSTQGGIRNPDGSPVALGYHTGHWEVGLLMQAAAEEFGRLGAIPFAGFVTDPCDGRTQGTPGMMDSLPYRNDAAIVLRRLMRSLPTRRGVMGVATCDKGLPAMLLALAGQHDLPSILVPGGVTLPPTAGEDAGKVQTLGVRFAQGEITLAEAADLGCHACGSPGGGCQFLGTAATSQVVAEALGLSLVHCADALWPAALAGDGAAVRAGVGAAGSQSPDDRRYFDGRRAAQCDGRPRRVWRQHELAAAYPGHRSCRRTIAAHRRRLEPHQRGNAASGGCAAQWAGGSSHRARLLGWRRA
ncbi:MAG: dihydroxy-acid dehydratase [Anaerolineales bacterium]|nr:dihydroxy-acid dehydratase [Anaerolineales bacterium]